MEDVKHHSHILEGYFIVPFSIYNSNKLSDNDLTVTLL